ncbi:hypothetical protein FHX82_001750 [Amycolatopsis bartoniae]|uniref:Uncharacterized protein n=1 Tax=Amycolatopsis bartoniae TaxID=941986 RepID=A0A8H9MBF3_9PSEU|nr:hypothetical protein [Amycolatopsis bartoniae]MBB2934730.1 hypothetical protein [Amycolatopsis bartoniae]GHF45191.1 hypothetical protein GCM10017566_17760 [Amycolatopsis bartoniae]
MAWPVAGAAGGGVVAAAQARADDGVAGGVGRRVEADGVAGGRVGVVARRQDSGWLPRGGRWLPG